jgi:hypothetical protein
MTTLEAETLLLDQDSIDPEELSMPVLAREIGLQKRPNWLLVKMMNALEQKRQTKGLGWSRAWNKYGMNTFRSHICEPKQDTEFVAPASEFLLHWMDQIDEQNHAFVKDLLHDPTRMVFTFYHNAEYDGVQYEGVTFSIGRKRPDDRTKRDRIDIVLEDKRVDGSVDGKLDRVRIYICPWETYQNKNFQLIEADTSNSQWESSQPLYDHLVDYYHRWKSEEDRQWSHWSVRYIDYFGPRSFIPKESSFT